MGPRRFLGNQLADRFAKLGAQQQQHPAWHRQAYLQRFQLVQDVLEFAAYVGVLGRGIEDTSPLNGTEPLPEALGQAPETGPGDRDPASSGDAGPEAPPQASPPLAQPAHGLDEVGGDTARADPGPPIVLSDGEGLEALASPPPPPLQLESGLEGVGGKLERARAAGHRVVRLPRVVFCQRCARYAQDRWIGLLARCPGDDPRKNAGRLNRLWQGKHPTTNRPF